MRRIFFANAVVCVVIGSGCALFESVDDPVYPEDATTETDEQDTQTTDTEENDSPASDVAVDASLDTVPDTTSDETLDDSGTVTDSDDDVVAGDADATATDVLDAADTLDSFAPDTTVVDSVSDTKDVGVDTSSDTKDSGADTKDSAIDTAPVCTSGAYSCAGNDLRQCKTDGSGYNTIVTCPSGTCSAAPARCTFCTPGALSCTGSQPMKCNALGSAYAANGSACVAPQTCGGGGTAGVCGCTPKASPCAGLNCGSVDNGCGTMVACGTCVAPKTCGGGGTMNVCGGCSASAPGPTMVNLGTVCIDSTEVTRQQYAAFLSAKGTDLTGQPSSCASNTSYAPDMTACVASDYSPAMYPNHPAVCIDWCDATAYCSWAGKHLCGAIGGAANSFSSLTTGEWYGSCAGGGGQPVCDPYCNCGGGTTGPFDSAGRPSCHAATGPYSSVLQLRGNAAEWENSCDGSTWSSNCRVRGGSYLSDDSTSTCGYTDARTRHVVGNDVGFRCCVTP